ncbi:zinc ribbon domain-containing protein [Kitasatospora sp. NPDC101235]|uniref:zinc ribbon domain-containing protein n=1 Tax=Kitasatospora sp. NPDC101235 TaxID=3364101 RepID=UPI00380F535A
MMALSRPACLPRSATQSYVMAVDPRNTSRRCPACGLTTRENRPAQDTFHCVGCGHQAHADTVGAVNVLRAGPGRAGPARRDAQAA